jgi:hypothetical protein
MVERKVTFREILASIVIIALMLSIGFVISNNINNSLLDKYHEYDTALQIDNNKSLFEYSMKTNTGNAFVYGELKAIDTVTYPEIDGKYSYIKKVKEKYTQHTRTVTKTRTVNGKTETYTDTEVYWSWDEVDNWSKHSKKISFLDIEYDYGKLPFPGSSYITTIKEFSDIRYVYYGAPIKCMGTLYAELKDNNFNKKDFIHNLNIEETIDVYESRVELVLFWFLWMLLSGGLVAGFCYIDNKWLEDKEVNK